MTDQTSEDVREAVLSRLIEDLAGASGDSEVLAERPSDRYLTGILYPPGDTVSPAEDDAPREESEHSDADGSGEAGEVPIFRSVRPSTFGLSFRVKGDNPTIHVELNGGRYERLDPDPAPESAGTVAEPAGTVAESAGTVAEPAGTVAEPAGTAPGPAGTAPPSAGRAPDRWRREPISYSTELSIGRPGFARNAIESALTLSLAVRAAVVDNKTLSVTLVVSNEASAQAGTTQSEEQSLFQAHLAITPGAGTEIVQRPLFTSLIDTDDRSAALLYRSVREFAVGHTCGATWTESDERCDRVATSWLPTAVVPAVTPTGSDSFLAWSQSSDGSAEWLMNASSEELERGLRGLSRGYRDWLRSQSLQVDDGTIPAQLEETARDHLAQCEQAADRIDAGINLIQHDDSVRRALQLANEAMLHQRRSQLRDDRADLRWRPFQLAFQLINLPSLADPRHPDRSRMDLLWFPTGGGKTEAYLALIAFVLFHRRLRSQAPDAGAGVAAIMRYTLRVLTNQQFQRAASMVAACELIRVREGDLGSTPYSIGLWIGGDATPNTLADARARPAALKVLLGCPSCGSQLTNPTPAERRQWCRSETCPFASQPIPIHVVDTDVYEQRPSLLLATIDKFAQITRQRQSQALFSLDNRHAPPDLILQDELHLISGPLGTVAGLYEIAIDEFCTRGDVRPKVIGSTATIRRAQDQVRALFNRDVDQFPPPGVDHHDSGFAKIDAGSAGRLYLGITTAGRSPKFTLQAVLASLAQAGGAIATSAPASAVDPYWTCVAYFNSLRELGGAVVLVEDDVRRSVERIAERLGEVPRRLDVPSEVTSRVPTTEIPELLESLATPYPENEIDVVLASNMISVGVDVPRLGLMVVNGQPKTTAEYIQATSRVGRGDTPGLVVVVYNAQRPRDRSRYESFMTWHAALYRDVEPTSVTPFAPRARDRALHAPLVSMLRLLFPPVDDSPVLNDRRDPAIQAVVEKILARVTQVDPDELVPTREELLRLVDDWRSKLNLQRWWWNRNRPERALLIGAEDQATLAALDRGTEAWPTPNSMREVEPATRFRFAPGLAPRARDADDA